MLAPERPRTGVADGRSMPLMDTDWLSACSQTSAEKANETSKLNTTKQTHKHSCNQARQTCESANKQKNEHTATSQHSYNKMHNSMRPSARATEIAERRKGHGLTRASEA